MPGITPEEQQGILRELSRQVSYYGQEMTLALDKKQIPLALRQASLFLETLRDKRMEPRLYYELYMNVCDQLRYLEQALETAHENRQISIVEMYEKAQHESKIIPRLYLLTTVASVYIKSRRHPAKDILFDLVELARGIQHPMRGLFFRNYLSLMSKDKLPDTKSNYEGDAKDSMEFILQNFGEMNKLWVRMQHQGAVVGQQRRENERKNLRLLVGTNLARLSALEAVDRKTYKEFVLPRVLEQVVNCKDVIAQEYLMDCIIQVFPDDFHLATLDLFLSTCSQLNESVNMKQILITLMERLGNFAQSEPEQVPEELDMFPLFHRYSGDIIEKQKQTRTTKGTLNEHLPEDVLPLQAALAQFTARCYPDRLDYVDQVLEFTSTAIEASGAELAAEESAQNHTAIQRIVALLLAPLQTVSLGVLELKHYSPLLSKIPPASRKEVAVAVAKKAASSASPISTVELTASLFQYLAPLITEDIKVTDDNRFEFEQEQHFIAQLFQLLRNEDHLVQADMYTTARGFFCRGGKDRQEFTLPPFIMGTVQLAQRVHGVGTPTDTKRLFGLIHSTISVLTPNFPELALRLYLIAATTALNCQFQEIAYEFMTQSFLAYESHISDSEQQFQAIMQITATLQQMRGFSEDNYSVLISKCATHSNKQMLKPHACRAVYTCAHLFWQQGTEEEPGHQDEKRVLACLKKAIKIANASMSDTVPMFIEILNQYLYFFDLGVPPVTVTYLTNLIELIDEHMQEASQDTQRYYENTLDHIKNKQLIPGEVGDRYREISTENEVEETEDTATAAVE
jgi:vacuolar protein sorting-associated protein 35